MDHEISERFFRFIPGAGLASLLLALLVPNAGHSAAPSSISVSSDVGVTLGGSLWSDDQVGVDNLLGIVAAAQLMGLPPEVDVIAYHLRGDGSELFAIDTATELTGSVFLAAGDVARFDGTTFDVVFDARSASIPDGVRTDAVSEGSSGDLVLSFDSSVDLGTFTADDEDIVVFDGTSFSLLFDGSASGVPEALDLDAVSFLHTDHVVVSFDGSGALGGVEFDDEDALELELGTGTWSVIYDASTFHSEWPAAELDAVTAVPEPGGLLLLTSGVVWLVVCGRRSGRVTRRAV